MKRTKFLLLIIVSIFGQRALSQIDFAETYHLPDSSDYEFRDMIATTSDDILMVGCAEPDWTPNGPKYDGIITLVDQSGTIVFTLRFPDSGLCFEKVIETSVGYTVCSEDVLITIDHVGNILWKKEYQRDSNCDIGYCRIESICAAHNGNIIAVGNTANELKILEINSMNGAVVNETYNHLMATDTYNSIEDIVQVDNGYVLLFDGDENNIPWFGCLNNSCHMLLIRIDNNLGITHTKEFRRFNGVHWNLESGSLIVSSSNELILMGFYKRSGRHDQYNCAEVVLINMSGDDLSTNWMYSYDIDGIRDIYGGNMIYDGSELVIVGHSKIILSPLSYDRSNFHLFRVDQNGDPFEARSFLLDSVNYTNHARVCQVSSNQLFYGGSIRFGSYNTDRSRFLLMGLNVDDYNCISEDRNPRKYAISLVENQIVFNDAQCITSDVDMDLTYDYPQLHETDLCQSKTSQVEDNLLEQIDIYPNPTNGLLYFDLKGENDFTITVLDISGRICISETTTKDFSYLDLSNLNDGIYLVRFFDKNTGITKTKKIQLAK